MHKGWTPRLCSLGFQPLIVNSMIHDFFPKLLVGGPWCCERDKLCHPGPNWNPPSFYKLNVTKCCPKFCDSKIKRKLVSLIYFTIVTTNVENSCWYKNIFFSVLEVGDLSNQLIGLICNKLSGILKYFSFVGGQITYSGVAAITTCKELSLNFKRYSILVWSLKVTRFLSSFLQ